MSTASFQATDGRDQHAGDVVACRRRAKRKAFCPLLALGLAAASLLGLSGCSTPGVAHAYLYSPAAGETTVRDIDPLTGAELAQIPAFANESEQVLGLTYDPYTDHLYLRLFPGNIVRVVDRPANRVKRVTVAPSLPLGGRDLAIRSRDRHLFFTDPNAPALIETELYGGLENYIRLQGLETPAWGVAYDALKDELLILPQEISDRVLRYDLDGHPVGELPLERAVQGGSLAYDSVDRTCYASLADGSAIGVFDLKGRLLRRLPRPAAGREVFIDIGPRSLLRLF